MHLFLSPHYDDAVYSCGGTIHRLAQTGVKVVIRTAMGGRPDKAPDSPIVRELHTRWGLDNDAVGARIAEDEAAVSALGASAERLNAWTDCVYRVSRQGEALYPTGEAIFGEIHADDRAAKLLPTVVFNPGEFFRVIYAPLGVGHHVDHQIVRNWALELKRQYPWVALKFYEDYPYSEKQQAVDEALTFFQTRQPSLELEAESYPLDAADVTAKVGAMALYKTQVSSFWGSEAAMETAVRTALHTTGGGEPAERFWRVKDKPIKGIRA